MTIDEIFTTMGRKMVEGLMFHSQLCDFFCFLSLNGYSKCQKYHYFEESCNYKKLGHYYLTHYGKIVLEEGFKNPKVIPENWVNYTRADVNVQTRKNGVQTGFEKWVEWETDVKKTYESLYNELLKLGETAAAIEVKKYLKDVDDELAAATQKWLELKATDWDLTMIIDEQKEYEKKYSKKMKEVCLC